MRFIGLFLLLGGLTACFAPVPAEPEPEPPAIPLFEVDNPGPWCGYATRVGLNPDVGSAEKSAIEALAQDRGC